METPKALPVKMQMIDGNGAFFLSETEKFLEELKKSSSTSSHYTVISIIGRQSGGNEVTVHLKLLLPISIYLWYYWTLIWICEITELQELKFHTIWRWGRSYYLSFIRSRSALYLDILNYNNSRDKRRIGAEGDGERS